jgi:tetratricopeptide (TPR) repeat protein
MWKILARKPTNNEREYVMGHNTWEAVWRRVRGGKHVIVTGAGTLPAIPSDLQVLCVNCQTLSAGGSVLDAVLQKLEQLLGETLVPAEAVQPSPGAGLRQRFAGDMPGQSLDALFVEACNRLTQQPGGHTVMAFESIDAADEITVTTLAQILRYPGWLQLPLLLTVRSVPQGLVAELIYLLCRDDGNEALIDLPPETTPEEVPAAFDWTALPADVLRVLRAGSVLGATFEAELVARLLAVPLGTVLETLQWAADAGVPLADRGEGRFSLPAEGMQALQSRILPSLLTHWHARLGDILRRGRPTAAATELTQPVARGLQREPVTTPHTGRPVQAEASFERSARDATVDRLAAPPLTDYAELFEPAKGTGAPEATPPLSVAPEEMAHGRTAESDIPPASPRQTAGQPLPPTKAPGDQPRAAAHLQAAGQTDAAIEQYLVAIQEAAARGDARRAFRLAEQALTLFETLPPSKRRALLQAQLLLEKGRLQWHGALLGASFTLQEALTSLQTAKSSLPGDAPPEVVGQLAAVIAGVCYDLGDMAALQGALETLTESSRRLLNSGESLVATRLLNDQAAVYMRLGDPVRASHLLSKSREVFERLLRQNPHDPTALNELAETNHLLARLPLHVQVRPGREAEAYTSSLEHARAAEHTYQQLGQQQQLARVWETMGRLELQRGQLQAAQERLSAALTLQQQIGDVTGLARSAAALADLFVRAGRPGEATALLADSIRLNFQKGSSIGLAFNRRAVDALTQAVAPGQGPGAEQLRRALHEVEGRLTQAESVLGRLVLPGEVG